MTPNTAKTPCWASQILSDRLRVISPYDGPVDESLLEWISAVTGTEDPKLIGQLPGSTTASLHVAKTDDGSLVVRRYDRKKITDETPDIAARDAQGLIAAAQALGELVPEMIAVDPTGEASGAPTLLMSFTSGAPAVRGIDLDQLSLPLARLHRRQAPPELPAISNTIDPETLMVPEWTTNEDAWRRAIEYLARDAPEAPAVFIHGDYHPGNVLWHQGEVSGIVDWPNAGAAPAARDVARCRTNLAFLSSVSTAEEFLAAYAGRSPGYTHDKWWDLRDLLSHDPELEGILALNAFGAGIDEAQAHQRADAWLLHILD